MRRIDLINGVNNLKAALEHSGILSTFSEKTPLPEILSSYRAFNTFVSEFGDVEFIILQIMRLEALLDQNYWASVISGERGTGVVTVRTIRNAIELLPQVVELLKQHNVSYLASGNVLKTDATVANLGFLTVILPEKEVENSSPLRLMKTLEAINLLYDSFAILGEPSDVKLGVAAIDSGSDKSFDFTGAAKFMQEIKELIISIWDRVVYHRERKASERIDLVIKTLPVFEKIANLEETKSLGPEQAEILRRNIFNAANNFISVGAVIPELDQYTYQNPRVLLSPEPKLLNQAVQQPNSHDENPHPKPVKPKSILANLSEEDLQTLKDMLKKDESSEE